jgi:N-acetylmuramoyl-L-alanine amidase
VIKSFARIGVFCGLSGVVALANPGRSIPTRPATKTQPAPERTRPAPATATTVPITVGKIPDYRPAEEWARRYSLQTSWIVSKQRILLKNAGNRIEMEVGSREMRFNGRVVFLGDPAKLVDGAFCVSRVDGERLLAGLLEPAAAFGRRPLKTIVIDPGHGGTDMGTQNIKLGLTEKVFALDVSQRVRKLLEARGYSVALTRETDVALAKADRAIFANLAGADLFISVHFNASPVANDAKTRGAEVFTFAPQFQRSTDSWGAGSDDREIQPAPVNRFDASSVACAHAIHGALLQSLKVPDRGQKIAHWGVLRGLNCPGVLVEAGFLSHEIEGKKIATVEYRQQIAEAIAAGVTAYADAIGAARK